MNRRQAELNVVSEMLWVYESRLEGITVTDENLEPGEELETLCLYTSDLKVVEGLIILTMKGSKGVPTYLDRIIKVLTHRQIEFADSDNARTKKNIDRVITLAKKHRASFGEAKGWVKA